MTLSHKPYLLLHPPPSTVNFLRVLFSFHSEHKGTSQVTFSVPTWPRPPLLTSRGCCLFCNSHSPHKFFLDTCLIKQTVGSLFPESLYSFLSPFLIPFPFLTHSEVSMLFLCPLACYAAATANSAALTTSGMCWPSSCQQQLLHTPPCHRADPLASFPPGFCHLLLFIRKRNLVSISPRLQDVQTPPSPGLPVLRAGAA